MSSTEIRRWTIDVRGLGGPMTDYCVRTYQVTEESPVKALGMAIDEFYKDNEKNARKWPTNQWKPFAFYSARIYPGWPVRRIDDTPDVEDSHL